MVCRLFHTCTDLTKMQGNRMKGPSGHQKSILNSVLVICKHSDLFFHENILLVNLYHFWPISVWKLSRYFVKMTCPELPYQEVVMPLVNGKRPIDLRTAIKSIPNCRAQGSHGNHCPQVHWRSSASKSWISLSQTSNFQTFLTLWVFNWFWIGWKFWNRTN